MADIKKNIDEILEKIKQHFMEEAKRLKETMVSYNKDYSKIEERVKNYQDTINQKVKDTIYSAINDFYSNMNNQVYTNYYEKNLNDYENKSEEATSHYEEISLFSSKYNAGETVLNIIKYLTKKYKQYIKLRINSDYEEYCLKMEKNVDIKGIEAYMAEHQHDSNASALWLHFQTVINWVNTIFPKYRKEMKGLEWGLLFNQYGNDSLDPAALETKISALMADKEVTKKSGVYEYLLSGKEKFLSLRQFDDDDKRAAYEQQQGICPICKKHFDFEKMHADHITPWHAGGKTVPENLQMLCRDCNLKKSGQE
jgi:hypothetical protein